MITDANVAAAVTAEWNQRTEAEYISAVIAQQVTLQLLQLGAPPDLIRDGLRIASDELTHAELSAAVAASASGEAAAPVIDPAAMALPTGEAALGHLIPSIVRFFCVGETIAVPLFRMLRQHCTIPIARSALDRIMRDETRHRQFGWDVLDWMLLVGGPEVRQQLADQAPVLADQVVQAYVGEDDRPDAVLHPELAAWGLALPAAYAATATSALAEEISPRFAARGLVLA
ncbi:MAG TPA: hypothetical protein VGP53_03950 [Acidimicrobiales bacterium]|nr:hypothetical protein [Acidimicrobiales bacterium]